MGKKHSYFDRRRPIDTMTDKPKGSSLGKRKRTRPVPMVSTVLPNEVWLQAFSFLSKRELKVVRLLGIRHLETLASSQLFSTAYLAARRGVMDNFKRITTHHLLRHFIKEVIYDCSWFDPPDGTSQMRNGSHRITIDCIDRSEAKLFQEHERIQSRELYQALKTAFTNLTHVRRVVCADMSRTVGLPGDEGEDLVNCNYRPELKGLFSRVESGSRTMELGEHCLVKPNNECSRHKGVFQRQYEGIFMLLQVLSTTLPPLLDELSLGDGRYSSDTITWHCPLLEVGSSYGGLPNWFFIQEPDGFLKETGYPIFQGLSKLDLTVGAPSKPKEVNSDFCPAPAAPSLKGLGTLLSTADHLVDLRLSGQLDTQNLVFNDTFGLKTWNKLRNLELKYFTATYSDLLNFISRHQMSLQTVTLDFFDLLDGRWFDLDFFVSQAIPHLKMVAGWVWQNGISFDPSDNEKDTTWLPRKKEDRHPLDESEPEVEDDDRESSSEDELDYDSGSEGGVSDYYA